MSVKIDDRLQDMCAKCAHDPALFVRAFYGWGEGDLVGEAGPDKWQLDVMAEISAYCQKLRMGENPGPLQLAVASGHGIGKALAHGEPVLTPAGWVGIEFLSVGDEVIAGDGTTTQVTGVFPQGKREVFRVVMDDGASVVTDGDHQWFTTTRSERKHGKIGGIRTTREIADSLTFANGPLSGLNHQIPVCGAVEHPHAELEIEPYSFGCWLGDGDAQGRITGEEPQFEQLVAAGMQLGGVVAKPWNKAYARSLLGVRPSLRALGMFGLRSHEKYIPRCYLHSSISQRVALLQGLLDTDGTTNGKGAVVFDVVSKPLADGVSELVRSLGGIARRSEKQGMHYDKVCRRVYRVFISLPQGITPFRLQAKALRYAPQWGHKNCFRTRERFIRSVEACGESEATCISVAHESKLFVTRDHIVTHNSALVAWIITWFMSTRDHPQIVVTANTETQLLTKTWRTLSRWHKRLANAHWFDWTATKFAYKQSPEDWYAAATPWSENNPDAFAGTHDRNVLVLFDEASNIHDVIWEKIDGAMSTRGAMWICFGNPTRNVGRFYECFHKYRKWWITRQIDSRDCEHADKVWVERFVEQFGLDADRTKVQILGQFPKTATRQLISTEAVEKAQKFEAEGWEYLPKVMGVDVARFGENSSTICIRQGRKVFDIEVLPKQDLMVTAHTVAEAIKKHRPIQVFVDGSGIGAGVVDRLRQLNFSVVDVNGGNSSLNPRFLNKRAEMWWEGKEFIEGLCELPNDQKLKEELTVITYDYTDKGRIRLDRKSDIMDEYGFSPDRADALMLTFAYPVADFSDSGMELEPKAYED